MIKRNENRLGYKKTKVGWIPDDWECVQLKTVGEVKTGPFGAQLHEKDYVEVGTPIVTVEHLSEQGLIYQNLPMISEIDKARLAPYVLQQGDIVFSRVGSVDRNSLIKKSEEGWLFLGRLLRVRPIGTNLDTAFLSAFFHLSSFKHYVRSIAVGGTMRCLNTSLLSQISIPFPKSAEQKKIAEILSAWDRAIEQTRELIAAKKLLKKGLMQQLLTGRMRFPEFGTKNTRTGSRFYYLPNSWGNPRISEIAREVIVRNSKRTKYTVLSCSKYDGFVNSLEYFGKKVYSEDTSNYKVIKRGQFGYPSNHVEEGSIGLLEHVSVGVVSPIYTIFEVVHEKAHAPYLYSLFKTETFRHIFNVSTNASVDRRGSLRWKEFSRIRVPLPSIKEQRRIIETLAVCDKELEILTNKKKALLKQKKGLMQKLLTGEVRVKLPQKVAS